MNPETKKILIAGSNGIIGTFLYDELKKIPNYEIFGLDKNTSNLECNYQADLTKKENITIAIKNAPDFDVLIFLVALAHEKGKNKELDFFRLVNYQTLVNLLEIFKENDKVPKKIIFSSTISVYGEKYNKTKYLEEDDKTPKSPYAVTKLEAEKYLLEKFNDNSWILRFAPVYSKTFKLNIQRRTIVKRNFYRVGDGCNKLSLLSINNIITVVRAIINNQVQNGVYNISDKKQYSFNDLLNYQNAKKIIVIPKFVVRTIYYINKIINNTFVHENTIKLITDNIYPSDKILQFVKYQEDLTTTI